MPPKPVHLKHPGRQDVWDVIRKAGAADIAMSAAEIASHAGVSVELAGDYMALLEVAGILKLIGRGPTGARIWRLVEDRGREAPRIGKDGKPVTMGSAREQMWRTMKMLQEFTAADLAIAASTPEHPVSEIDARDYTKHLAAAGYLIVALLPMRHKPGRSHYRFVKAKNTGPKPPQIQRLNTVYDPNLGKIVWHSKVPE